METRKVQVTGGSTYTVSLPKEWAEENGVSAGSVVKLFHRGQALLMKPKTNQIMTVPRRSVASKV